MRIFTFLAAALLTLGTLTATAQKTKTAPAPSLARLSGFRLGNTLKKGNGMTAAQCSCGFTELADEGMTDHLHRVFESEDGKGNDGLVHEDGSGLSGC